MAKLNSKVIISTILGIAAGIGIGILIAPAKGSKTRQRLRKKAILMAESLEEGLSEKFRTLKSELTGKDSNNDETGIPEDKSNETKIL